jgi:hypothetical protein
MLEKLDKISKFIRQRSLTAPVPSPLIISGSQTTLQYRSFNPNVDPCTDPANAIIYQNNPAYPEGMFVCSAGSYNPLSLGSAPSPEQSVKVRTAVGKTVNNNNLTFIDWEIEVFDTNQMHDPVGFPSGLICKLAGRYTVTVQITIPAFASGVCSLRLDKNRGTGTAATLWQQDLSPLAVAATLNINTILDLIVNDYLEFEILQTSGSPMIITGGTLVPNYSMSKL